MRACTGLVPGSQSARAFASIVGFFAADAAATSSHWNYELGPFADALRSVDTYQTPEFVSPTLNPFYAVPLGYRSCYGDQAFVLLSHLVANGGELDPETLADEFDAAFRPDDEGGTFGYGTLEGTNGLTNAEMPIAGPWRHGSIKGFVERMAAGKRWPQCGSDDAQADCLTKIVPLVAACAGKPWLTEDVEDSIRVTQDSDDACLYGAAFAKLLEAAILGDSGESGGGVEALASALQAGGSPDERQVGSELMSAVRQAEKYPLDLSSSGGAAAMEAVTEGLLKLAGGRPLPGLT